MVPLRVTRFLPRGLLSPRLFGSTASVNPPSDFPPPSVPTTPSTISSQGAREASEALGKLANTFDPPRTEDLSYSVRRTVLPLSPEQTPLINGNDTFIAPNAQVIGDVFVGEGSSLWYGSVVRGDNSRVFIGAKCSIGDKTVINSTPSRELLEGDGMDTPNPLPSVVTLGNYVTIGAGSVIAGDFTAENGVRIGEACVVGEGVVISGGSSIESGSTIPPGTLIPAGETWGGSPLRKVGESSEEANVVFAQQIEVLRDDHIHEFLPYGDNHRHLEAVENK